MQTAVAADLRSSSIVSIPTSCQ